MPRLREVSGKFLDRARRLRDWFTHSWNRSRAHARAIARGRPHSVVFVCYGNICRSPYAAAALNARLRSARGPVIRVESAGLFGPGRPANSQALRIARERGLELASHRSQLLDSIDRSSDALFLVMTHEQKANLVTGLGIPRAFVELLRDFDVANPPAREIMDPYGQPDAVFREVFAQIDRSIEGLADTWRLTTPETRGARADRRDRRSP